MEEWKRGMRYEVGTLIQRRDGYVFMKTTSGMRAYHRVVAEMSIKKRPLKEGEVVIRISPDRLNNKPGNLVVVQHALTKFAMLPAPRIIFVPRRKPIRETKGLTHI